MNLKDALKGKIPEEKIKYVPRSFDVIGDIAIFHSFPEELKIYERLIGETLLKLHKNVKTVAKKIKEYSGIYRTMKIKIIAGKKKKITLHKENRIALKIDVEKCYFSPRLSTERLRIAKLVRPGEDVLVMFSGVAPYPLVISKNSEARLIYGVEINPVAHKYALENLKLNKAKNVILIKGDVRKEVPKIIEERKPIIGFKAHFEDKQLKNRLALNPKLIEFFFFDGDLENNYEKIVEKIKYLKKKKILVMLHQPNFYKGKLVDPSCKEFMENTIECYKKMYRLVKRYNLIGMVVHPFFYKRKKFDREVFLETISKLKKQCKGIEKKIYLENLIDHCATPEEILDLLNSSGIENTCIDIVHVYIQTKSNKKLVEYIEKLKGKNCYFHIGDTLGNRSIKNHTIELFKGKIDFERIKDKIKIGVIEVKSKNETLGKEAIRSYKKFMKLITGLEKFDRVLMPLPKNAENFLDLAIFSVKKKGTIHFYDFLHESEIPDEAIKKIKKHCKAKILNWVRCGQYSPRKYRVCIDFQPL